MKDYLISSENPLTYLEKLEKLREEYNGYNLLLMNGGSIWYYSNRIENPYKVSPGIHGLSNHLLDTPWPKVEKGKTALSRVIKGSEDVLVASLFELLSDRERAGDEDLPQTGVTLEWERLLSSIFIQSESYGTRSSAVLLVERGGLVRFYERSFGRRGQALNLLTYCHQMA